MRSIAKAIPLNSLRLLTRFDVLWGENECYSGKDIA
jgi:hypothetical protein